MNARQLLEKTRQLLSEPRRWTKNFAALDDRYEPVPVQSSEACRFCLVGAIERCRDGDCYSSVPEVFRVLEEVAGRDAVLFNDDMSTTHEDVLNVLDEAIRRIL